MLGKTVFTCSVCSQLLLYHCSLKCNYNHFLTQSFQKLREKKEKNTSLSQLCQQTNVAVNSKTSELLLIRNTLQLHWTALNLELYQ